MSNSFISLLYILWNPQNDHTSIKHYLGRTSYIIVVRDTHIEYLCTLFWTLANSICTTDTTLLNDGTLCTAWVSNQSGLGLDLDRNRNRNRNVRTTRHHIWMDQFHRNLPNNQSSISASGPSLTCAFRSCWTKQEGHFRPAAQRRMAQRILRSTWERAEPIGVWGCDNRWHGTRTQRRAVETQESRRWIVRGRGPNGVHRDKVLDVDKRCHCQLLNVLGYGETTNWKRTGSNRRRVRKHERPRDNSTSDGPGSQHQRTRFDGGGCSAWPRRRNPPELSVFCLKSWGRSFIRNISSSPNSTPRSIRHSEMTAGPERPEPIRSSPSTASIWDPCSKIFGPWSSCANMRRRWLCPCW